MTILSAMLINFISISLAVGLISLFLYRQGSLNQVYSLIMGSEQVESKYVKSLRQSLEETKSEAKIMKIKYEESLKTIERLELEVLSVLDRADDQLEGEAPDNDTRRFKDIGLQPSNEDLTRRQELILKALIGLAHEYKLLLRAPLRHREPILKSLSESLNSAHDLAAIDKQYVEELRGAEEYEKWPQRCDQSIDSILRYQKIIHEAIAVLERTKDRPFEIGLVTSFAYILKKLQ